MFTEHKFYTDQMLGKLCKWLRILGFDTIYCNENDFIDLQKNCNDAKRIFLSRSRKNIEKINLPSSLLIQSEDSWEQLKQVFDVFCLKRPENIFTRCLDCNEAVINIDKKEIKEKIPEKSFESFNEFNKCPKCGKIFWKGTHYDNTLKKISSLGI
jgi:uncharacterized protein